MRRYTVERIEGLPPKKDGANSMWNKPVELQRLITLRHAFVGSVGNNPPLSKNISITLRIYVGPRSGQNAGDLDNFITGICDGLQAAHGSTPVGLPWQELGRETIHPSKQIAIVDDAEVVSVDAKKIFDYSQPWYSLELEGE